MRRGVVIAFAILGLSACGQKESTESGPVDAPRPPVGAPAKAETAAPKPEVGAAAPANPSAEGSANCLDLVAAGSFAAAVPVCTEALKAQPENQELQTALETAKAKVADMAGGAADAAKGEAGAAEDAADKAKEAMPSKPY
jgi:hypothetical protein